MAAETSSGNKIISLLQQDKYVELDAIILQRKAAFYNYKEATKPTTEKDAIIIAKTIFAPLFLLLSSCLTLSIR